MKTFRDRLNQLIESYGITNFQLAKVLNVKEGAIRFWRKGRSIPRKENLDALASFFHVHPAWLLYGEKDYAPSQNHEFQYIIKEAEKLGVKEDILRYGRFRIAEAKRQKHEKPRKGKNVGNQEG